VKSNAISAALSSTVVFSLPPNVLLVLFPHYASGEGESSKVLALVGQALAAGGLLGNAFLHMIAHAGGDYGIGIWVLLGYIFFLVANLLMRSLGGHCHSHGKYGDGKHHHLPEHKTATVYLNLAANAMHNLTGGLATIDAFFAMVGDTHKDASVVDLMKSHGGLGSPTIRKADNRIVHDGTTDGFLVEGNNKGRLRRTVLYCGRRVRDWLH
jgi:hypothetical protein